LNVIQAVVAEHAAEPFGPHLSRQVAHLREGGKKGGREGGRERCESQLYIFVLIYTSLGL